MNKGLFIHLAVTVPAIAMWLFIVGSEDWTIKLRAAMACTLFLLNLIIAALISNDFGDFKVYSEKIKL